MESIYGWIRNITYYFLFLSVLNQLLPGKAYGKYIKLFSGMVLILLFIQPLTGNLRLEERLARYYEKFVFQYETEDLKQELLGMENKRLQQMIEQYEAAVAMDVTAMAREEGYTTRSCRVTICPKRESEEFGTVERISMTLSTEKSPSMAEETIAPVEPITIGPEETKEVNQQPAGLARGLRRKVASYYDLEEDYVEIQVIEGEG